MTAPSTIAPIVAETRTYIEVRDPTAYNCFRFAFLRSGSAIVHSEFGERRVRAGNLLMLSANVLCGCEPDGPVTVTTVYVVRDYLADQIFWQNASTFSDRLQAREFLKAPYIEPAQILTPSNRDRADIESKLDEVVRLSDNWHGDTGGFFALQAALFSVLRVVAPYVEVTAVRRTQTQRRAAKPLRARQQELRPVRTEAHRAATLLEENLARAWTLGELAGYVHLSRSRLADVFTDAFGKPPHAYLAMKRVEMMAKLLRETTLTIGAIAEAVGWRNHSHASAVFRRCVGVSPSRYREIARRSPDLPRSS